MNRSELREIVMRIIYQVNILESAKVDYDINSLIKEQLEIENDFVKELVEGVLKNKKELTDLANKYLEKWTLDRFNKVDQAIFLIGIYELVYTNTPSIVSINEAVNLSKKYSDDDVVKMINGVLDSIFHSEVENGR